MSNKTTATKGYLPRSVSRPFSPTHRSSCLRMLWALGSNPRCCCSSDSRPPRSNIGGGGLKPSTLPKSGSPIKRPAPNAETTHPRNRLRRCRSLLASITMPRVFGKDDAMMRRTSHHSSTQAKTMVMYNHTFTIVFRSTTFASWGHMHVSRNKYICGISLTEPQQGFQLKVLPQVAPKEHNKQHKVTGRVVALCPVQQSCFAALTLYVTPVPWSHSI